MDELQKLRDTVAALETLLKVKDAIIESYQKVPYQQYPWYQPYAQNPQVYVGGGGGGGTYNVPSQWQTISQQQMNSHLGALGGNINFNTSTPVTTMGQTSQSNYRSNGSNGNV